MNTSLPHRATIRKLIYSVIRDDSSLDAFCLDHFQEVYSHFSSGMDRVAKVTLLLESADNSEVLARLRETHPISCQSHERILKQRAKPFATANADLIAKLDHLYRQREDQRQRDVNTQEVDEQIRVAKKALRQGPRLAAGEILGDRYKLDQVIGSGGFADVWLAWDRYRTMFVAIKVLHSRWNAEHDQGQRFERGARIMHRLSLQHSGFVKVISDGIAYEDGFCYFVMEYLCGGDLRGAVLDGRLTQIQALTAICQVGEALHFAHEQGLVHRDVKPQNILLDGEGRARLSDFDLVMADDTTGGTRTGALGTFLYAAPEELEDAKQVDRRADVYSLGMTALFVLARKNLPSQTLRLPKLLIDKLNCSQQMKIVLETAIAWESKDRFPSTKAFIEALFPGPQTMPLGEVQITNTRKTNLILKKIEHFTEYTKSFFAVISFAFVLLVITMTRQCYLKEPALLNLSTNDLDNKIQLFDLSSKRESSISANVTTDMNPGVDINPDLAQVGQIPTKRITAGHFSRQKSIPPNSVLLRRSISSDRERTTQDGVAVQNTHRCIEVPECAHRTTKARELSQNGQFDAALIEYQTAYTIQHDPAILFNLGRIAQKKGDLALAIKYYEQYLASAYSEPADIISKSKTFLEEAKNGLINQNNNK